LAQCWERSTRGPSRSEMEAEAETEVEIIIRR
jgi:hypothetical protein